MYKHLFTLLKCNLPVVRAYRIFNILKINNKLKQKRFLLTFA